MKSWTIATICLALAAGASWAAQRFRPPDLGETYAAPSQPAPAARTQAMEWVDLAVLAVALAASAHLALRTRRRAWAFVLMLAALAYFGLYRAGCICPIGAIQNVALALTESSYAVPMVAVLFFALPLATALFFGRAFCASVCPLGAIQDLLLLGPVQVPGWLEAALRLPAHLYLGLAVVVVANGGGFLICRYDPFVAFFRFAGSLPMLILGVCVLLVGVFVGRPYCRFFCPYGVLLGWASRLSRRKVTITPDECIRCRLCETSCPFGAIRRPNAEPGVPSPRPSRARLAALLALAPLLVAMGAWGGWRLGAELAGLHPQVALDDRIRLEDAGAVAGWTDASKAFREAERDSESLHAEARQIIRRFQAGSLGAGAYVGLVLAAGLLRQSISRRREDYEADRASCLACGRCFAYCPREQVRRGTVGAGGSP